MKQLTSIPDEVLIELKNYSWPGNVRELKMVLTNLYALFKRKKPTASNIRDIFMLEGQIMAPPEQAIVTVKDLQLHRAKCLRHLERGHEVIHACQFHVTDFLGGQSDSEFSSLSPPVEELERAFHYLYHEIDTLCQKPLLFHGVKVFEAVYGLKGKLYYILNILKTEPQSLIGYLQQEVVSHFNSLMVLLFEEIESLLEE